MIVVTGTMRSGTSMWMQILEAAGFPVLGTKFPGRWEETLRDANPRGFYESDFRTGVYFDTNPHPKTGRYIEAARVRDHAVKIFAWGVTKTERAYLDRVLCTVRDWRAHARSMERLNALEDAALEPTEDGGRKRRRGPAWAEWWNAHYDLLRDASVRRFPLRIVTYEALLADAQAQTRSILEWLGRAEHAAEAAAVVDAGLRTQAGDGEIDCPFAGELDAAYDLFARSRVLGASELAWFNEANNRVQAGIEAGA